MNRLTAENYYEDGCPPMDIPLDVRLGPQENAARYFKQYAKAKTAEKILTEQLGKGREELTYLESVVQELSQAEAEQDFNDIRAELDRRGVHPQSRGKKQPGFQRASRPRQFRVLRRAADPGGTQQPAERPAHRQGGRPEGYLAPHPEDPRLPCDSVHRGRRSRTRPSLYEAACLAAYYLPGPGGWEGAGGLHPGAVCEKARRGQAGHGGVHHLSDHAGRSGRPAGEEAGRKIKCEIKLSPRRHLPAGAGFAYGVKGGTVLTRWAGTSR